MAFKLHRNRWKGIKWRDTIFAARVKRQEAIARALFAASLACGLAQIKAIACTTPIGALGHIEKRLAFVEALLSAHEQGAAAFTKAIEGQEKAYLAKVDAIIRERVYRKGHCVKT
jgi:hypothetical protein